MADTVTTLRDPLLTDNTPQPKGVLQKNLKMFLYLGAVVLLILATVISSRKKAPTDAEKAKGAPPQPYVQDNTASNVDALQRQLGADKLKAEQDAQLAAATGTGAQQAAASGYGPDGRPLNPAEMCIRDSSNSVRATVTACRWASRIRSSPPTRAVSETDFGAEKVASHPARCSIGLTVVPSAVVYSWALRCWTNCSAVWAVSYTHLDVYKRQHLTPERCSP